MRIYQLALLLVSLLIFSNFCEAKKKKQRKPADDEEPNKTKTRTKWSSSSNLTPQTRNAMVATEEHGYYVKRTFLPLDGEDKNATSIRSPPFLAVPIVWFPCKDADCLRLNSLAMNTDKNSLNEGFLCDDDCLGPYEPICGKTPNEIAVFYNKCKLNVAKCRSHGYWSDFDYDECKTQYPEQVKYAEMKFSRNPYFIKAAEVPKIEENKTEIAKTEDHIEESTTPSEQLLVQRLNDTKPVEKLEESKDLYKNIN